MQQVKAAHLKISSASVLTFVWLLLVSTSAFGDEEKLEKLLDKIDQPQDFPKEKLQPVGQEVGPGQGVPESAPYGERQPEQSVQTYQPQQYYGPPRYMGPPGGYTVAGAAPPVTPTPQVFTRQVQPGRTSYAIPALAALKNSALWRNIQQRGYAGEGTGLPGGNPFNLSPFGMLHYMWDDTTYTSSANPVTLYQVQNDLQYARQQSQLAQAAAQRAKYAQTPQERAEAAQQAQYYASQAQSAAQRAQEQSDAGSLNPADVARAVAEQAANAQNYARQARGTSEGY